MMEKLSALKKEHPVMFWGGIAISVIIFVVIVRGSSSSGSTTTASSDDTAASTQLAMAQLAEQEDATDSAAQTQQAASANQLSAVQDEDNTQVLISGNQLAATKDTNATGLAATKDTNAANVTINGQDTNLKQYTVSQQSALIHNAENAGYYSSLSNNGILDANDTSVIVDGLKNIGTLGS
ncbi:hypothetical protein GC1_00020 [Gluconobacter phage GC1]|uniref:Uncharacterized protein n=1 Tax=Gluconobacter phage GC1 TaxID=2047788 RepID=A0A2I5AR75_9VIRU|nr:hypothetical protein FDJ08_gp20 [Gluconobacter phage GC1]ATS92588.1 hypothetical protein GC1_00020 [Gluconobacter phage GC1]